MSSGCLYIEWATQVQVEKSRGRKRAVGLAPCVRTAFYSLTRNERQAEEWLNSATRPRAGERAEYPAAGFKRC